MPTRTVRIDLPGGDASTDATVAVMRAIIHDCDLNSPAVDTCFGKVFKAMGDGSRSRGACSLAVYDFLRNENGRFRFTPDPDGVELLRHPEVTAAEILNRGYALGDCDDRAMLGCVLIRRMALSAVLAVVGTRTNKPYQHVFWGYTTNLANPLIENCVFSDPQENVPHGSFHPLSAKLKIYTL